MRDDAFVAEREYPPGCTECGAMLPIIGEMAERIAELEELLELSQKETLKKVRQIQRLQKQQAVAAAHDPDAADSEEVFRYWKESPAGRGAREFGQERREHVLARLHAGYSVAEIKEAIDGASTRIGKPYNGRTTTTIDLSAICKNERNLRMFIGLVAPPKVIEPIGPKPKPPPVGSYEATWAKHEESNHWRRYADEIEEEHPARAERIRTRALLLDTNPTDDVAANQMLLMELRQEVPE